MCYSKNAFIPLVLLALFFTNQFSAVGQNNMHPLLQPLAEKDLAPFYFGVASGDPLAHQVILWTKVDVKSKKYANLRDHGYFTLQLSNKAATADFYFVDTVKKRSKTFFVGKRFRVSSTTNTIRETKR